MVEYSFLMANFLSAIMFLVILSNFGAASDIYGDEFVVINSAEMEDPPENYDFDLEQLRFNPEYEPSTIRSSSLTDNELINSSNITFDDGSGQIKVAEGETEGLVAYDIASRSNTLYLPYSHEAFFAENVVFKASDQVPPNNTIEGIRSISYTELEGDSPIEINQSAYSTLRIDLREQAYVDVSGGVVSTNQGFFEVAGTTLTNAARAVTEVPLIIAGYISFTLQVPGLLGTILKLYFGLLLSIMLVDLIWIG